MQGLWDVPNYDKYGNKRRKKSRKNFIKDKLSLYKKTIPESKYRRIWGEEKVYSLCEQDNVIWVNPGNWIDRKDVEYLDKYVDVKVYYGKFSELEELSKKELEDFYVSNCLSCSLHHLKFNKEKNPFTRPCQSIENVYFSQGRLNYPIGYIKTCDRLGIYNVKYRTIGLSTYFYTLNGSYYDLFSEKLIDMELNHSYEKPGIKKVVKIKEGLVRYFPDNILIEPRENDDLIFYGKMGYYDRMNRYKRENIRDSKSKLKREVKRLYMDYITSKD